MGGRAWWPREAVFGLGWGCLVREKDEEKEGEEKVVEIFISRGGCFTVG